MWVRGFSSHPPHQGLMTHTEEGEPNSYPPEEDPNTLVITI